MGRGETVVACWWQLRRGQGHRLSDVPWHLVQRIVDCEASLSLWRGTFAHKAASFGKLGNSPGEFSYPSGIAVLNNGDLVVSKVNGNRIQRMSPTGASAKFIARKGSRPGQVLAPQGICVLDDLHILVADCGNQRVQRLRVDGDFGNKHVRQARPDVDEADACQLIGVGVLGRPRGVAVHRGDIYVADHERHCIAVFSLQGALLRSIGALGHGAGQLCHPAAVHVCPRGELVVLENDNNRVQVLRADDGAHVRFLLSGELSGPSGAAVDGNVVFVADTYNNRVVAAALDDGRVLAVCGKKGVGKVEFGLPLGVAVLADGSVAVTDYWNNCVQKV